MRRGDAMKSCAEISQFLAKAGEAQTIFAADQNWPAALNCTGAAGVPEAAALELLQVALNPYLQRWKFSLRCVQTPECAPFLVWMRGARAEQSPSSSHASLLGNDTNANSPLVARGQTALLTWERAGIRIVLPVTCLEAGGAGQFVLVRFQNAGRSLRAQVTGTGTLRASS
jgi:hypothetical protein